MTQLPHPLPLLVQEKIDFYTWNQHISRCNAEYTSSLICNESNDMVTVGGHIYNWRNINMSKHRGVIFNRPVPIFGMVSMGTFPPLPKNYYYTGITTEIC